MVDERTLRVHQVELVVNARPGAQTTILVTRMGSHFAGWLLLEVPRRRNIIRSLHCGENPVQGNSFSTFHLNIDATTIDQ